MSKENPPSLFWGGVCEAHNGQSDGGTPPAARS